MKHEIKCPKCGTGFTIDEAGYAEIVQQVRNEEFEKDVKERAQILEGSYEEKLKANEERIRLMEKNFEEKLQSSEEAKNKDLELAKKETAEEYGETLSEKENEISQLKTELAEMKSELAGAKTKEQLAIAEAVAKVEREKEETTLKLERERAEATAKLEKQLAETEAKLGQEKTEVAARLEREKMEATAKLERERDGLKKDLENIKAQEESKALMVRQNYEQQLRDRDEMIERLKDLKAKLSTKMVGETLEQHCQNEFNRFRATAFPNAEFGKDNKVSDSGSKGDFIFRDFDDEGNEIVSIMFEMKNENDTTTTKHKNEHFFKELDKDRREKNCEYAVLVSLLEADNELYNQGIVDVSYEYPKMFVIRPQFFLPLIGIIANTAKNSLEYKTELARVRNQNVDITNFEEKLNKFKESFMLNSDRAAKNFEKAINDIDKSIKNLEDTKRALLLTVQNFGTANKKLEDLTVKRLTRGNETMKKMFSELESGKQS